MSKPTLRKGPATSYEAPNEVIREFGDGKGNGGLLSLRKLENGQLVVEVYQVSGPVLINTPKAELTPAQRSEVGDEAFMGVSAMSETGVVAAVLTEAEQEELNFYRALNVPGAWFVGERAENGSVEVIFVGSPDDDGTGGFVWSVRMARNAVSNATSEASVGVFESGINC